MQNVKKNSKKKTKRGPDPHTKILFKINQLQVAWSGG